MSDAGSESGRTQRVRAGETARARFRAPDRCFLQNGQWYFATREGFDVGPYRTREAATAAATGLVAILSRTPDPAMARRAIENYGPVSEPWSGRIR
jgi:hypothetical protein